jgi:hypothetical protein
MRADTKTVLSIVAGLGVSTGCKSVESFDTGNNSVYCLDLIGEAFAESGLIPEDAGTVASSDGGQLRLAVTIDAQHLSSRPGLLWSNDADFGICRPQPLLNGAPMRAVQGALHDVVSTVQLTPDHIQDVFFWVDSTCESTFVGILSLIDGGSVELRLFKPKPATGESGTAEQRPGFAVFARSRRQSTCSF